MLNVNLLPTHLLIGVRKSATSWIWKQFTDHPEVYAHPEKELYFFNNKYNFGLNWYSNQFQTNKKKILEATPDYFNFDCASKIKNSIPNIKLMVCLRNPIDRAFSHWKFGCYVGNCNMDFLKAWKSNWNDIRNRGLYHIHLQSFKNLNLNLNVYFYDDLLNDSKLFIDKIYDDMCVSRHCSIYFKNKWMPGGVSENFKDEYYKSISEQPMSEIEKRILHDFYFSSIKETEKILGKDLNWLNF